jgi:hypothetical protein
MTTPNASFSFSFTEGTLQIEGSELFVSQQVEAFREKILEALSGMDQLPVTISQLPGAPFAPIAKTGPSPKFDEQSVDTKINEPSNPFPRVLDVMSGKIKITTSIKCKTTSEKVINLILAYLWAKERLINEPTAEYKELRDLCEEHACLDSSNFSSTLTSKKHLILIDGSKGSSAKTCKLTYPGREAAEEILDQLNTGAK